MSVSNNSERPLIDRLKELKEKLDKAQKQAGILRTYSVHNNDTNRKDNNENSKDKSDQ